MAVFTMIRNCRLPYCFNRFSSEIRDDEVFTIPYLDMPFCFSDVGNIAVTALEFVYSTRSKVFRYFVLVTEQGSQSDGCGGSYSNYAFRKELLKGFGDRFFSSRCDSA